MVDPSSFMLGALIVTAKALAFGAAGFGIAWLRARERIRELEAERQLDQQPVLEGMERIENTLDTVNVALQRLATEHDELQRRLPPPRSPSSES